MLIHYYNFVCLFIFPEFCNYDIGKVYLNTFSFSPFQILFLKSSFIYQKDFVSS